MESAPKPQKPADFLDPKKYKVKLESKESPAELESRLRCEEEDAAHDRAQKKAASDHERFKDLVLFIVSLSIVAISALSCLGVLIFSPSQAPWAAPLLTLIVGGFLGYQTGKLSTSKPGP
jgi:hypothetical protein